MKYIGLCVTPDYNIVYLCELTNQRLYRYNGNVLAKDLQGRQICNVIRASTKDPKQMFKRIPKFGVDIKDGETVAVMQYMDVMHNTARIAFKLYKSEQGLNIEVVHDVKPDCIVNYRGFSGITKLTDEVIEENKRNQEAEKREIKAKEEQEEKNKRLKEIQDRHEKEEREQRIREEAKQKQLDLERQRAKEEYEAKIKDQTNDNKDQTTIKENKTTTNDTETINIKLRQDDIKLESNKIELKTTIKEDKTKDNNNETKDTKDKTNSSENETTTKEDKTNSSENETTRISVSKESILNDIDEDEEADKKEQDNKNTDKKSPISVTEAYNIKKDKPKIKNINREYNPNCERCNGSGKYQRTDGTILECLCYEEYAIRKHKLEENKKAIELSKKLMDELVDLGVVPKIYRDKEFNGEELEKKIKAKMPIIRDTAFEINPDIMKENAIDYYDKQKEYVKQSVDYYKKKLAESNLKSDTNGDTILPLVNMIKHKVSSGESFPLNIDLMWYYRPLITGEADTKYVKMKNKKEIECKTKLCNYSNVLVPLLNEIIAACRNGMELKNSYLIGADKGFGKKTVAYQCIRYMHARGQHIAPYVSLTEIGEYRAKYMEGLIPKLHSEYYSVNAFELKDKNNKIDESKQLETKVFKWEDFLTTPVLFTYISGTANLRCETETLQQLLNIRGTKCLPTIIFSEQSIKFLQSDVMLNNYYWRNMLNHGEEEYVYDSLVYKSSYIDTMYGLNNYVSIKRNTGITGMFDNGELIYLTYNGYRIYTTGEIIEIQAINDKYNVKLGEDI